MHTHTHTGLLRNTDEGMPITPIDEADVADVPLPDLRPLTFTHDYSPGASLSSHDEVGTAGGGGGVRG